MIAFEYPYYLNLAWLAVAFIAATIFIRRRSTFSASRLAGLRKFIYGYSPWLTGLKSALCAIAFTCMSVALARPVFVTDAIKPIPINQSYVVLALDVSQSMLINDVAPDRLSLAKNTIAHIIQNLNGQQVALVIFAGNANTYIPPTSNYKTLTDALQYINPQSIANQGTSLTEAIKTSALLLHTKDARVKTLCILSDGENHSGDFAREADSAIKAGINIFVFGTGTVNGGVVKHIVLNGAMASEMDNSGRPIVSRLITQNLLRITGNQKDRYQVVASAAASANGFTTQLNTLEGHIVARTPETMQLYKQFLLAALLILILEMLLPASFKKP